jgi:hypothetical protein
MNITSILTICVFVVLFVAGCAKEQRPKLEGAEAHNNRGLAYFYIKEYDNNWSEVTKVQDLGGQIDPEFLKLHINRKYILENYVKIVIL